MARDPQIVAAGLANPRDGVNSCSRFRDGNTEVESTYFRMTIGIKQTDQVGHWHSTEVATTKYNGPRRNFRGPLVLQSASVEVSFSKSCTSARTASFSDRSLFG
jgi:hypothetical protein